MAQTAYRQDEITSLEAMIRSGSIDSKEYQKHYPAELGNPVDKNKEDNLDFVHKLSQLKKHAKQVSYTRA